jgi:hypothetical protein
LKALISPVRVVPNVLARRSIQQDESAVQPLEMAARFCCATAASTAQSTPSIAATAPVFILGIVSPFLRSAIDFFPR